MYNFDFSTAIVVKNGVLYERWNNIGGTLVVNLRSNPRYLRKPDRKRVLKTLKSPVNIGSNFGARLTTYFKVM